jgi:hypothetical protein
MRWIGTDFFYGGFVRFSTRGSSKRPHTQNWETAMSNAFYKGIEGKKNNKGIFDARLEIEGLWPVNGLVFFYSL